MRRSAANDTESGIAFGYVFTLVFLIFGAITILTIFALQNGMMPVINQFIMQGKVSSQTANAISFVRTITMALPIIALLGCFLWAMMRGVQSRDGMAPTSTAFYTGWIVLVSCCIISFLMAFLGGFVIDSLYTELDKANLIQGTAISAEWNSIQNSTMFFYINAYFALTAIVPCLGIVVFFKSVVWRTVGSRYMGGY